MKKIIVYILFLTMSLSAQSFEKKLLSKIPSADNIEKIGIYNQLCWKLRSNDPSKSIEYGNRAVELIKKIKKPKLLSKSYNFLGVTFRNSGNYSKALFYYTKALNNALEYSDSVQIAYSHNNLGGIYRLQGNNPLALKHMLIAIKYFEATNNKSGIGFCAINIGIVYLNEENFEESLKYLDYSLKIRKQINYKQGMALSLYHIALLYTKMQKYPQALKNYKELLSLFTKLNDIKGIASCYEGFSTINYERGQYQSSLKNIKLSKNLLINVDDKVGIVRNHGMMALIYARLKNFSTGRKFLDSAKVGTKRLNIQVASLELLKVQSEFYEIEKNFKKAFTFLKKHLTLKDSIFSKKRTQLLITLQSNFEIAKKEKENRILKKEAQLRLTERNYLFVITILVVLLIFGILYRSRTLKRLSKELKVANATKNKFFNIIAHDLRNPFNTSMAFIDMLISEFDKLSDTEKKEILYETKNSFSKNISLLENLLEWSWLQRERMSFSPANTNLSELVSETATSQREAAQIKNIDLQLQLDTVEYNCDKNMMRTSLRNLISNAIKFTPQDGKINIELKESSDNIDISISDSGIGIDSETISKLFQIETKVTTRGTNNESGTGLGLILCKEFIELNGGTLSVKSEVNVGSTFTITLPKN